MTTFPKSQKLDTMQKLVFAKSSPWGKNENSQKHAKNNSTSTLNLSCAKNSSKKQLSNIRNMTTFPKSPKLATMQRPLQNRHFRSRFKILKNMPKTTLEGH